MPDPDRLAPPTRRRVGAVVALTVLASCGGDPDVADVVGDGATAPSAVVAARWSVEVVRDDLEGPTQIALTPDGRVVVAELAGAEDEGSGRVRDIGVDGAGAEPVELVDGLLTPTGVAVRSATSLTVQEQRRVSVVTLDPARTSPTAAVTEVVVDGLPFNGRSQGTLTPMSDGRLLHVATGTGSGRDPAEGSGVLYALRPDGGADPVAVGFKNAYAHAFGPGGELYVTEIGDGTYDGERPPGELDVITPDVLERALRGGPPYDGGWPRCTGDAEPTEELGATVDECEALPQALATFPPGSTPTSVAVTTDGRVLVALWVDGRVVEVDPTTGALADVLTGVGRPQHLLALPDGDVLLAIHDRGELWRLTPP